MNIDYEGHMGNFKSAVSRDLRCSCRKKIISLKRGLNLQKRVPPNGFSP